LKIYNKYADKTTTTSGYATLIDSGAYTGGATALLTVSKDNSTLTTLSSGFL